MRLESGPVALAAVIALVVSAGSAAAGDWELEIHGAGLLSVTPSSGVVTQPPQGRAFETVVPGVSSYRVTSWYFGDGGVLLTRQEPRTVALWTSTYTTYVAVPPLDPVLSSATVRRPFRGGAGLRLGRRLGRRLTAELEVGYGRRDPTFSQTARAEIENSRASFESAWSSTLSAFPDARVSSRAVLLEGRGHRLVAIGVLNVNLETGDGPAWSRRSPRRRFVSYLSLGAGLVSSGGEEASATLVGDYQFASAAGGSAAAFHETDNVTIRSRTFGTGFVGVAGLGWKQDISTRWGVRLDARAYLSRNRTAIVIDAQPSVTKGHPASAVVVDSSVGPIQFVNDSSGVYEGQQSSLSGPAIAGLETFRGTGIRMDLNFTIGMFLRF
jgi:hypothetical protein